MSSESKKHNRSRTLGSLSGVSQEEGGGLRDLQATGSFDCDVPPLVAPSATRTSRTMSTVSIQHSTNHTNHTVSSSAHSSPPALAGHDSSSDIHNSSVETVLMPPKKSLNVSKDAPAALIINTNSKGNRSRTNSKDQDGSSVLKPPSSTTNHRRSSNVMRSFTEAVRGKTPKSTSPTPVDTGNSPKSPTRRFLSASLPVKKDSSPLMEHSTTSAPVSTTTTTLSRSNRIRLSSIVWKRRSGLGKLSAKNAWERRRIVLEGTKLYYFTTTADLLEDVKLPSSKKWTMFDLKTLTSTTTDDPSIPRGILDVRKERASVTASMGHSGAPTPFCISLKVKGDTYWKFCFDSHATLMEWLAALTDVVVESSVEDYNLQIVQAADPHNHADFVPPQPFSHAPNVQEPTIMDVPHGQGTSAASQPPTDNDVYPEPSSSYTTTTTTTAGAGHRLWMMGSYTVSYGEPEDDDDDDDDEEDSVGGEEESEEEEEQEDETPTRRSSENATATTPTPSLLLEQQQQQQQQQALQLQKALSEWNLRDKDVYAVVVIVNVALMYSQASSTSAEGFWYVVTFCNLGLWYCLVKEEDLNRKRIFKKQLQVLDKKKKAPSVVEPRKASLRVAASDKAGAASVQQKAVSIKRGRKSKVAAAAEEEPVSVDDDEGAFRPRAGTTTVQIKNETDLPVNSNNHVFGGWRIRPGNVMQVRSQGYLQTKQKVPSPGELYECAHVEIFESPQRYPDMAPRVKLPEVAFNDNGPKTWRTPDIFVISVSLPTDPPKLRGSKDDGGGYTVTMYFRMKQETRDILRRVTADNYDPSKEPKPQDVQTSKVNAVKLLEEWCRRAPTDPNFQSRFKLVATAQNLKEIGMPGWISKYNGKPVLIKRAGQTGFLYPHPELNCMEFDISFHPFPYLAKQAICYMKEHFFKKVLVTFGFVIEGRADDELPECLIGLMQLCYPDPIHAIQAKDFFAGTCARSFD